MPREESAALASSPILERIGDRVRERRRELAFTLRELAEQAGVSERFLVMLEGGRANVSVVKLDDIARALGTTAAELIVESPGKGEPRYRESASKKASERATAGASRLIALLGLRGAGKTTIGKKAAERLGQPFLELDTLVAERAGMSLGEIFEMHGAAYYRKLEREALERLVAQGARGVLATGGGLVTDLATFELLRNAAVTVWLKARPGDHWDRVIAQGDARPMAKRPEAMSELRALLRARRALYEQADHVVDTSALGFERSVDRVVKIARRACSKQVVIAPT